MSDRRDPFSGFGEALANLRSLFGGAAAPSEPPGAPKPAGSKPSAPPPAAAKKESVDDLLGDFLDAVASDGEARPYAAPPPPAADQARRREVPPRGLLFSGDVPPPRPLPAPQARPADRGADSASADVFADFGVEAETSAPRRPSPPPVPSNRAAPVGGAPPPPPPASTPASLSAAPAPSSDDFFGDFASEEPPRPATPSPEARRATPAAPKKPAPPLAAPVPPTPPAPNPASREAGGFFDDLGADTPEPPKRNGTPPRAFDFGRPSPPPTASVPATKPPSPPPASSFEATSPDVGATSSVSNVFDEFASDPNMWDRLHERDRETLRDAPSRGAAFAPTPPAVPPIGKNDAGTTSSVSNLFDEFASDPAMWDRLREEQPPAAPLAPPPPAAAAMGPAAPQADEGTTSSVGDMFDEFASDPDMWEKLRDEERGTKRPGHVASPRFAPSPEAPIEPGARLVEVEGPKRPANAPPPRADDSVPIGPVIGSSESLRGFFSEVDPMSSGEVYDIRDEKTRPRKSYRQLVEEMKAAKEAEQRAAEQPPAPPPPPVRQSALASDNAESRLVQTRMTPPLAPPPALPPAPPAAAPPFTPAQRQRPDPAASGTASRPANAPPVRPASPPPPRPSTPSLPAPPSGAASKPAQRPAAASATPPALPEPPTAFASSSSAATASRGGSFFDFFADATETPPPDAPLAASPEESKAPPNAPASAKPADRPAAKAPSPARAPDPAPRPATPADTPERERARRPNGRARRQRSSAASPRSRRPRLPGPKRAASDRPKHRRRRR